MPFEGDSLTPGQMHEMDARLKAAGFERRRLIEAQRAATTEASQDNYDVRWYDITIRVDDTLEAISGKVTCLASATVDNVQAIALDLDSVVPIDSITMEYGLPAFARSGDVVTITLDRAYHTGELFRFDCYYHGDEVDDPTLPLGLMFGAHQNKPVISSLSEPYQARLWWPCKDRPDDKADSLGIHIEVDTALYCASNGTLDSIVAGESAHSRVFHYTCRYPIATYLFSLAIASYTVWEQSYLYNGGRDTMPIVHHVFPDYYLNSQATWIQTPECLDVFSRAYGPYPFLSEKYGHANAGYGGGAMEHQTVTSMAGNGIGFDFSIMIHELAHQWWGDMVTCKYWQDVWLNEGWASYSEAVYQLDKYGWSAYHSYMNTMVYLGDGSVYCYSIADPVVLFDVNLVYNKAAWVVHMLRGVLGEERFAAGISAYRNAFAYSSASTEEFKNVWEEATGVQLDTFIDQWVYGQRYPQYQYSYWVEREPAGGYDVFLQIQQIQTYSPRVFKMPVDFYFGFADGAGDTVTLQVDERSMMKSFHFEKQVTGIELDPAGWILKTAQNRPWSVYMVTQDEDIPAATVGKAYFKMMEARAATGTNTMSCIAGQLPYGLTIESSGLISGTPTMAGEFTFAIQVVNSPLGASDYRYYHMTVNPTPCCVGRVGNVNGMDGDEPTIADISLLIDMLFIRGNQPDCMAEADINRSGGAEPTARDVTISDISMLIDYLFISGPTNAILPDCPGSE